MIAATRAICASTSRPGRNAVLVGAHQPGDRQPGRIGAGDQFRPGGKRVGHRQLGRRAGAAPRPSPVRRRQSRRRSRRTGVRPSICPVAANAWQRRAFEWRGSTVSKSKTTSTVASNPIIFCPASLSRPSSAIARRISSTSSGSMRSGTWPASPQHHGIVGRMALAGPGKRPIERHPDPGDAVELAPPRPGLRQIARSRALVRSYATTKGRCRS